MKIHKRAGNLCEYVDASVSASVSLSLSLSLSDVASSPATGMWHTTVTTYIGCHLFITTNQRTHPHKTNSTRARGGPWSDLELAPFAVHAISAIKPPRVESLGEKRKAGLLCNKVLNHWRDINPKLWHTLSMHQQQQALEKPNQICFAYQSPKG